MNEVLGILSAMLSIGTPLMIAASGETVLERAGVLNIGLEGVMLCSAFFAFLTDSATHSPWLGLAAGVVSAVLLMAVSSAFVIKFACDQVVTGTAVNLLSLGITGSLFAFAFGKTGKLVAVESVPKNEAFLSLNPLMLLAAAAPLFAWILLTKTRWGLAARGCGESPESVSALGFSVIKTRLQASGFAAVCAGIAGSYLTIAQTNSFAPNMTAGIGFVVLAAVTFGRWSIAGTVFASLLIALGYGAQFWLKAKQTAIPYQLFDALPYLSALIALICAGRSSSAPASLARPFSPK